MSWLARSLANSLRLDDDGAENDAAPTPHHHDSTPARRIEEARKAQSSTETGRDFIVDEEEREEGEEPHGRGVREDLTELTQTLTRQLWGVATFLAPPPPPPPPPPLHPRSVQNSKRSDPADRSMNDSGETSGIGPEFAEIGGRLRTGVTEISKMASNYFPFGSEENHLRNRDGGGGGGGNVVENYEELESQVEDEEEWEAEPVGITEEVLAFAKNIAMHPETWLDFPLDEEEDLDDFVMSNAQREHGMAIEQLAPRLAALRIELCPCHMTESYFWKVYFVLLHSRLNKHDAEILSTPQVMEARAMWMQELHKQTKPESDWSGSGNLRDDHTLQHEDFAYDRTFYSERTANEATDYETKKHPIVSSDVHFVDKSVIEEKPVMKTEDKDRFVHLFGASSKILNQHYEDDDVDWPEDDSDLGGYKTTIPLGDEEDISFSDLEDDANSTIPIKPMVPAKGSETTRR